MAHRYTAMELMDLVQQLRQKPRESEPTWLLRLWDSGAESAGLLTTKVSELATTAVHPALRQRLYAGVQYTNHSIVDWLMVACHIAWPNKSDIPLHPGFWSSMEDLQNYIDRFSHTQFSNEDTFESPDKIFSRYERFDPAAGPFPSIWDSSHYTDLVASESVVQHAATSSRSGGERVPVDQAQYSHIGGSRSSS